MIVWYYLSFPVFASLKLHCMLLRVINDFLFFFGSFIAYNVLYIINVLLIFVDFYMNDKLHEVSKNIWYTLLEVIKKQYKKIT